MPTLSGRVIDHETRQPVPHINIFAEGPTGGGQGTTNYQGNYSIQLNPGVYKIKLRAEGRRPITQEVAIVNDATMNFESSRSLIMPQGY